MTTLHEMLRERIEEFDVHYSLAVSLEDQIFSGENISIGSTQLSARHLSTMKSGLIVHLYNIVEALMSQSTQLVEEAFGAVPPQEWSEKARREWLREHGVARIEGAADARLRQMETFSLRLLKGVPLGRQRLRKPPGTWENENITMFAERLGITLGIEPDLHRALAEKAHLGDRSPLVFLADRRNALAHGQRSFEDGARDLTLEQIRRIADTVLEFMAVVASGFEHYLEKRHYVVAS